MPASIDIPTWGVSNHWYSSLVELYAVTVPNASSAIQTDSGESHTNREGETSRLSDILIGYTAMK